MKLDPNSIRYLTKDEFRVLVSIELGMRNHEVVPSQLIESIAQLKRGGTYKTLLNLLKLKLVNHENKKYDGYTLTYQGYDYLAIKTLIKRGLISGLGPKIGTGKESDIYLCCNEEGQRIVLKLARLGRTSFRAIKNKRDYLQNRTQYNWLYLSRLSSVKEYSFMKVLHEHDFPTPTPIEWNRHAILMTLAPGYQMNNIQKMANPHRVYNDLIGLIIKFAQSGLIHSDFNEFNLMVDEDESVTVIDFPQMVSTSHPNAEYYFNRDIECIKTFFKKRFGLIFDEAVTLQDDGQRVTNLDQEIEASGFIKNQGISTEDLEVITGYYADQKKEENGSSSDEDEDEAEESSEEENKEDVGESSEKFETLTKGEEENSEGEEERKNETEEAKGSGEGEGEEGEEEEGSEGSEEEEDSADEWKRKKEEKKQQKMKTRAAYRDKANDKEFVKKQVDKQLKKKTRAGGRNRPKDKKTMKIKGEIRSGVSEYC